MVVTSPAELIFPKQRSTASSIHPTPDGKQWAQLWVSSEEEAEKCMEARAQLSHSGITMTRITSTPFPTSTTSTPTPAAGLPPRFAALTRSSFPPLFSPLPDPPTPSPMARSTSDYPLTGLPSTRGFSRQLSGPARYDQAITMGYRHLDPNGPAPRNLYIVDLPLDMTEVHFRSLFERFGMVEHCKLLSQLDGMGRRRGFILMTTHRDAMEAIRSMNGFVLEMDVSWALVQREARQFGLSAMPNRVIHPPVYPPRMQAPQSSPIVIVEGLDPDYFPSLEVIREMFSPFGSILRCSLANGNGNGNGNGNSHPDLGLTALMQFEQAHSAQLLLHSSGMIIGTKQISVRLLNSPQAFESTWSEQPRQVRYQYQYQPRLTSAGFNSAYLNNTSAQDLTAQLHARLSGDLQAHQQSPNDTHLNATSSPFVPLGLNIGINSATQQDFQNRKTPSPPSGNSRDQEHHHHQDHQNPKSSPSVGLSHSTSTKVSSSSGKYGGGQHERSETQESGNTASSSAGTGSGSGAESILSRMDGMGLVEHQQLQQGEETKQTPAAIGVALGQGKSKMHERWLNAGMKSGENKWFKSTAWCE